MAQLIIMWKNKSSLNEIADTVNYLFNVHINKSTVQNALKSASYKMETTAKKISDDIRDNADAVHIDETTYPMGEKRGYVWGMCSSYW